MADYKLPIFHSLVEETLEYMAIRIFLDDKYRRPSIVLSAKNLQVINNPMPLFRWCTKPVQLKLPWSSIVAIYACTRDCYSYTGFEIICIDEDDNQYAFDEGLTGFKEYISGLEKIFPGFDRQACEETNKNLLPEVCKICWSRSDKYK
jgi:hypothetical protein